MNASNPILSQFLDTFALSPLNIGKLLVRVFQAKETFPKK